MRADQTGQVVPEPQSLNVQLPRAGSAGLADFAQWLQAQPAGTRSQEDIERQIDEERRAWDENP